MSPDVLVTYLPGRSSSLDVLKFDATPGAQAATRGLDALKKARIVLKAVVEPIVL
jgi:hypothetical protein